MGVTLSCPFADFDDFESYLVRSISKGGEGLSDHSPKTIELRPFGSGQLVLSFRGRDEHAMSRNSPDTLPHQSIPTSLQESDVDVRHEAALTLQKTYKSFRTRRQLADCAVIAEQRWWKLLDFAELKLSSVSFFEIEKPETAVSRWSRATTRAAKVGKGLSKDEKARKLALQHWLEAIDPRHRYGHNLHFYYSHWLQCDSKQPFFYWLDVGQGWNVNLERCPRSKLQQQCIKYLGPTERCAYEVIIRNGRFMYKQKGTALDTREGPEDGKWIFVLSAMKILYVGQKRKGTFQHSSFLAGGATLSAGRLVVEDGILKAVWPYSGHYLPTEENFEALMTFFLVHNVDLSGVQRAPDNEEEAGFPVRRNKSVPELSNESKEKTDASKKYCRDAENIRHPVPVSRWSRKLQSKIALLQIPARMGLNEEFSTPKYLESPIDGYETADDSLSDSDSDSDSEFPVSKHNLFDREAEEEYKEPVPKEKIMKRINSHKGVKSYQLANRLCCKWTTGAGPRIGCVRDYPSELQLRALEEMCLSPRHRPALPVPTPPKDRTDPKNDTV
ncbi:calmodulin-binding family protein [Perilla frutescens var. hirtella]|uniref:Calmodulin-binding family protein n=1 Tax=Perilla frutescens var. hirtella TaxID=608512 RepID=A0AAD4J5H5_PERFH|nr:calmodulin-binding family protein [Perilla frutescens var. hirtella]